MTDREAAEFGIIGESDNLQEIYGIISKVAPTDATILITGETGVGKELVAQAVHRMSKRADKAFVALNCASIPDSLIESELFGFRKGAFTDAKTDKKGKIELAEGGTLFLDEIGDLSPMAQAKILRVLEEREFDPVGGLKPTKVDVRIITATNVDLPDAIRKSKFRGDLFHRINEIGINIKPLRERREDVLPIVRHFIAVFNERYGKHVEEISDAALAYLRNYPFPGNIRELRNMIQKAVLLNDRSSIWIEDLPMDPFARTESAETDAAGRLCSLKEMEEQHIRLALKHTGFNISQAARFLDIQRATLYEKMKTYNIQRSHTRKGDSE